MDIQVLNQLLKTIREALEWLQKILESARKGGLPPFDLLPEKSLDELTTAHLTSLAPADDEELRT